MYRDGFVLIGPEYVVIRPEYINTVNENHYHIFSAKQNIITEEFLLKSDQSICGTVSLKKKPLCRRFEENLSDLTFWAMSTLEEQFCENCSKTSISEN